MFKVKLNTGLAIAWLTDDWGNTIELSQDIKDLQRKCDQINEVIKKEIQAENEVILLETLQEVVDAPHAIPRCREAAINAIRVINERKAKWIL
jgi:hypothetical protein